MGLPTLELNLPGMAGWRGYLSPTPDARLFLIQNEAFVKENSSIEQRSTFGLRGEPVRSERTHEPRQGLNDISALSNSLYGCSLSLGRAVILADVGLAVME
jgi:hypothetical protein